MFKVKNRSTRTIASFWYLYLILNIFFTPCSSVSIVNFEQVNAGWKGNFLRKLLTTKCIVLDVIQGSDYALGSLI